MYQCTKIKEHFPKAVHIFGRWTKIIYNGQPARQKKPSHESEQMETEQEQQDNIPDEQTNPSQTIIEETSMEQMPPPTTIQEIPVSQMPQPTETNSSEVETPTTTTTQPITETLHPTMNLTIDEFPTLPTKRPTTNPSNTTPSEEADFSDDSVDQSPVITIQKPIQTTFKQPLESTSDSEEQATTVITKDQRNTVIKECRELHKHNFRDVDKLKNINMDKKKENNLQSNVHRTW